MLKVSGVAFAYRRMRPRWVLDGIDWEVSPGETTLLLGPNGAGKSTLLKLMSGFERPRRGSVTVNGRADRRSLYAGVGWMPQDVQPARGLTALEQVEYVAWLGGASRREARSRARDAIAQVDLDTLRSVRAAHLSGGQLRRLGLAQALVRGAPVLLLDEPTAGLDPAQALNFRELLPTIDAPGGLVISTHQVDELAAEVDRVVVLMDGSIRFDGSTDQFRGLGEAAGGAPMSLAGIFAQMIGGGKH